MTRAFPKVKFPSELNSDISSQQGFFEYISFNFCYFAYILNKKIVALLHKIRNK